MARPQTVAIIGLGLMGGSLAAAVRRKIPKVRVLGISRNRAALRDALRKGWVHEAARTLEAGIPRADFVVLCTPVDTLRASLAKIDRWAKKGTVVTDVGSVKGDVLRWTPKTGFRNIRFIGAHPMAGSHAR
ncbi:MAG: prephenate dehydrogenase/arogenate dehydrogenase family protein, partial [Candidatus Omnitrophota bacterium]